MNKWLRVYLHPDGDTVVDIGVADGFDMGQWWNAVKQDGGLVAQGAVIPTSVIHHVMLVGATQVTNLTVYPGGKPN